ncbi:hypothetical protein Taro_048192 [Colocasia esculenta]|uniref:Uncharacterized protein n=1 Tax=Colocasia esculenta TaxID=4460 RepID=A0A843X688_COLES|nr:hypothetical protein [Colocasia esculenta]
MERRSSLVPRVPLQESLGLFDVAKVEGESDDEYLDRLTRVRRRELASELGAQADLDLLCFLVLFLGRLLFATRGDAVHCRFLSLVGLSGQTLSEKVVSTQPSLVSTQWFRTKAEMSTRDEIRSTLESLPRRAILLSGT